MDEGDIRQQLERQEIEWARACNEGESLPTWADVVAAQNLTSQVLQQRAELQRERDSEAAKAAAWFQRCSELEVQLNATYRRCMDAADESQSERDGMIRWRRYAHHLRDRLARTQDAVREARREAYDWRKSSGYNARESNRYQAQAISLQAEVERLRARIDELDAAVVGWREMALHSDIRECNERQATRIATLKNQAERLRDAISRALTECTDAKYKLENPTMDNYGHDKALCALQKAQRMLVAALGGES